MFDEQIQVLKEQLEQLKSKLDEQLLDVQKTKEQISKIIKALTSLEKLNND